MVLVLALMAAGCSKKQQANIQEVEHHAAGESMDAASEGAASASESRAPSIASDPASVEAIVQRAPIEEARRPELLPLHGYWKLDPAGTAELAPEEYREQVAAMLQQVTVVLRFQENGVASIHSVAQGEQGVYHAEYALAQVHEQILFLEMNPIGEPLDEDVQTMLRVGFDGPDHIQYTPYVQSNGEVVEYDQTMVMKRMDEADAQDLFQGTLELVD